MPGTAIADRLQERIRNRGPIPFAHYMEKALYDPEHGYYAQPEFTTGRSGDFATAPDTGPLLGATLARPIQTFAQEPGRLIELGPGSGRLIDDILTTLDPAAQANLDVILVEPFQQRHEPLQQALEPLPITPRIVTDLDTLQPARSFLIANELLDALPCEVVRRTDDGLERLSVDHDDTRFTETWEPAPSNHPQPPPQLPPGHRYEIAPSLPPLLANIHDTLNPGLALLLDYGGRIENIWNQRPDGTLRAFRNHQQVDPLTDPGHTDITYDIDFPHVSNQAQQHDLPTCTYGAQERLLVHLGLMETARDRNAFLEAKQLLVPGSFAGRFQSLVLGDPQLADRCRLRVDLDDPGLWDRGLTEPLGDLDGDLETQIDTELESAWDPPPEPSDD